MPSSGRLSESARAQSNVDPGRALALDRTEMHSGEPMTDLMRWEIKTWGQVGASLLSLTTVLSALTGLWEISRDYRGDVVAETRAELIATFAHSPSFQDFLFIPLEHTAHDH